MIDRNPNQRPLTKLLNSQPKFSLVFDRFSYQ
jgi:hypothetical protein